MLSSFSVPPSERSKVQTSSHDRFIENIPITLKPNNHKCNQLCREYMCFVISLLTAIVKMKRSLFRKMLLCVCLKLAINYVSQCVTTHPLLYVNPRHLETQKEKVPYTLATGFISHVTKTGCLQRIPLTLLSSGSIVRIRTS